MLLQFNSNLHVQAESNAAFAVSSSDPVMQDHNVAIGTISNPAKTATLVLPNRFCPFSAKRLPPVQGALLKRAVKGHKLSKGTPN